MVRAIGEILVIASHNAGKLREISDLVAAYGVTVRSASDFDLAEPEETAADFAGNARIKAHFVARATGFPALADDSGLRVDALDGDPGVYSADWAETPSGRDFGVAMARVHERLLACAAPLPWAARFHCTLCLAFPDGTDALFEGSCEGTLIWPPRGQSGFGYDPTFVPSGGTRTFAEMSSTEKIARSHRSAALVKFADAYFS